MSAAHAQPNGRDPSSEAAAPAAPRSASADPLAGMTPKQVWQDCVWLSDHPDDTSSSKLMLLCIGRFFDENAQSSSMSYGQIARECRFDERSGKRLARKLAGRWLSITVGGGYHVPGKGQQNLYHGICPPDLVERLRDERRKGTPILRDGRLEAAAEEAARRLKGGVTSGHPDSGRGDIRSPRNGERGDPGAGSGWHRATRTPKTPKEDVDLAAAEEVSRAFALYAATAARCGLPIPKDPEPWLDAIAARLRDSGGLDGWAQMLAQVEKTPFLRGENESGFRPTLGWLTKPENYGRVRDGEFAPWRGSAGDNPPPGKTTVTKVVPNWWRGMRNALASLGERFWSDLIRVHAVDGQWPVEFLGPAPLGEPGCIIPEEVIRKLDPELVAKVRSANSAAPEPHA